MEDVVARLLTLNPATLPPRNLHCWPARRWLTTSPGIALSIFPVGVVCYSNELKTAWAERSRLSLIHIKGAVSRECCGRACSSIRRSVRSLWSRHYRDPRDRRGTRRETRGYGALALAVPKASRKNARFRWCRENDFDSKPHKFCALTCCGRKSAL